MRKSWSHPPLYNQKELFHIHGKQNNKNSLKLRLEGFQLGGAKLDTTIQRRHTAVLFGKWSEGALLGALLKAVQKETNTCSGPVYYGERCGKHESGEIVYRDTGFLTDSFPPSILSDVTLWNPEIESPAFLSFLMGQWKEKTAMSE